MFRTNASKELIVHRALNAAGRITASNLHVVCLDELVAELLYADRSLRVPLGPKKLHTLSQKRNASGRFSVGVCCRLNGVVKSVKKSSHIERAITHELLDRFRGVERNKSILLDRGFNIYTVCLQA